MEPNEGALEGFFDGLREAYHNSTVQAKHEMDQLKRIEPIALNRLSEMFQRFEVRPAMLDDDSHCPTKKENGVPCATCSNAMACALLKQTVLLMRAKEQFEAIGKITYFTAAIL